MPMESAAETKRERAVKSGMARMQALAHAFTSSHSFATTPVILSRVDGERISKCEKTWLMPRFAHFEILSLHTHPPGLAQNDGGARCSFGCRGVLMSISMRHTIRLETPRGWDAPTVSEKSTALGTTAAWLAFRCSIETPSEVEQRL